MDKLGFKRVDTLDNTEIYKPAAGFHDDFLSYLPAEEKPWVLEFITGNSFTFRDVDSLNDFLHEYNMHFDFREANE